LKKSDKEGQRDKRTQKQKKKSLKFKKWDSTGRGEVAIYKAHVKRNSLGGGGGGGAGGGVGWIKLRDI